MFSREMRKLGVTFFIFVIALVFSFCIINDYAVKTVDATDTNIEINNIYVPSYASIYQVYGTNLNEVYPALPLEGELCSNNKPIGIMVTLNWYTDGFISESYETNERWLTYTASFELPSGYTLTSDFAAYPAVDKVYVIDDFRPEITSLGCYFENVKQNEEYTLPETLKGTVNGEGGLVDIAVIWDSVADTTQNGTKVYTATAVNGFNYKVPTDKTISAQLTLTVGDEQSPTVIKQHYQKDETLRLMVMNGYTFLGWAKADDASLGVLKAGAVVPADGDYFAIFTKLEYLGVSFRFFSQGVRYGFALHVYGLNNEKTNADFNVEYVKNLIAKTLQEVTFTATIYGKTYEYTYTSTNLKYGYMEKYEGYVANLVFEKITDAQLDESVKVDACFEIGGQILMAEGKDEVIRVKAQEAYDETKFDTKDQATIDEMVKMYGVKVNKS